MIYQPTACEILHVKKESLQEYTFRVKTDFQSNHGQFLQISIPKVGEAPISVSDFGEGWMEFTIRSVGKVTDEIFNKKSGDILFLRGPYGNGWPFEYTFQKKHLIVITGGTGLAPVRSMLNACYQNKNLVKSVTLIAGFKNKECIVFREELEQWKNAFQTYYTLDHESIMGWHTGLVTDHIDKIPFDTFGNDYEVVIVGPPPMMKFTGIAISKCGVPDEKIWVSFERKMSCAIGKCGHCRIDEVYVCVDGPVFSYTIAKNLVD